MELLLGDALGSVRQLTDGNAEVILAQTYEPYGEVLSSAGAGGSSYAHAGEWADTTGLQYLRARYMNPAVGRYLIRGYIPKFKRRPCTFFARNKVWKGIAANL